MAASKRTRFEILTRDGYRCRYCGDTAQDGAKLKVARILPSTLGGLDDPDNLVSVCSRCEVGRSALIPNYEHVEDHVDENIKWAHAEMEVCAHRRVDPHQERDDFDEFDRIWRFSSSQNTIEAPRDGDWAERIWCFFNAGLNMDDLASLFVDVVRPDVPEHIRWERFCDAAWEEIRSRRRLARRLIDDGAV